MVQSQDNTALVFINRLDKIESSVFVYCRFSLFLKDRFFKIKLFIISKCCGHSVYYPGYFSLLKKYSQFYDQNFGLSWPIIAVKNHYKWFKAHIHSVLRYICFLEICFKFIYVRDYIYLC